MTPEQRAELRRLCEAMKKTDHEKYLSNSKNPARWAKRIMLDELIASRTALPELLDYVEKLEGEIERLKKEKA